MEGAILCIKPPIGFHPHNFKIPVDLVVDHLPNFHLRLPLPLLDLDRSNVHFLDVFTIVRE